MFGEVHNTRMIRRAIFWIVLLILISIFIAGCGDDLPLSTETLKVKDLEVSPASVSVGETVSIKAVVDYSGDVAVLMYDWSADTGAIQGDGSRAIYVAPSTPGIYAINLRVTDGVISSDKTVDIVVVGRSMDTIILDRDTHWQALSHESKLAYSVNIKSITGGKVLLHYEIVQDMDNSDVFLTILIDNNIVLDSMAIGGEQPSTGVVTIRDLDVSNVITAPGRYMIVFSIVPGNRAKDGWLMREAKILGAKGTSDPQQ